MSYAAETIGDFQVSPQPATSGATNRVIGDYDKQPQGLRHYKDSTKFGRRSNRSTQE